MAICPLFSLKHPTTKPLNPKPFYLIAPSRLYVLQVGGTSVVVATLLGRVERNVSSIGVAVTRSAVPRAIVPQVGHVVVCRCKLQRQMHAI